MAPEVQVVLTDGQALGIWPTKLLLSALLCGLGSPGARAAEAPAVWIPPDYRIVILEHRKPKPDGEAALVRRKNLPETVARLDSVASFKRFVETMKRGEQVELGLGCVYQQFVERDSGGKARKGADGREVLFLPLGKEKISLEEAAAFCAARGVKFTADVGGP